MDKTTIKMVLVTLAMVALVFGMGWTFGHWDAELDYDEHVESQIIDECCDDDNYKIEFTKRVGDMVCYEAYQNGKRVVSGQTHVTLLEKAIDEFITENIN